MTERKFDRRDFLKGIALGATSVGLTGIGIRNLKEGSRTFVSEVSASENGLIEFLSPEKFSSGDGWEKFTWQGQETLINQRDGWLATRAGDFLYSMENQLWVGTWLTPEWKKYRGAKIFGHPISDSQEKTLQGRYIQSFENLVVGVRPGERDSVHFVDIGREMCSLSLQKEDAEIAGEFKSFWDTGGEGVLGKPISERLATEDNVVTQYFENGKLNFNPKTGLVSLENLGEAWSKKKTQEGVLEKPRIYKLEDLLPFYIEEIKKGENPNIIYIVIARTLWESKIYKQRGIGILEKRFFEVVNINGNYKIEGMGYGKASAFLHIKYPNKYGVWNSCTNGAFRILGVEINGENEGERYKNVNELLNELLVKNKKSEQNLNGFENLSDVDIFVWYVANNLI